MSQRIALLSVYDKTGIVEFAQELIALDWKIISSGGTARVLREAGLSVTDVEEVSGVPPILGHRVVTLVPEIHGGLLATEEMRPELERLGYPWIDLVCVDLYPLEQAAAAISATIGSVTEMTDIGGPTLLRSAAKGRRIVISRTEQRGGVLAWLKSGESRPEFFRELLAMQAELTVSAYASISAKHIASFLALNTR